MVQRVWKEQCILDSIATIGAVNKKINDNATDSGDY